MCPALVVNQFLASKGYTVQCTLHRWARYFKKVAERALALALYKAFKAIAAQKKKFKALQNVKTIAFEALLFCKSF